MILEIVEALKNKGLEFPRAHNEIRRDFMAMLYPILEFGTMFMYKGSWFKVVGQDITNMEIEAVKVPFDEKYYWFEVLKNGTMIQLVN